MLGGLPTGLVANVKILEKFMKRNLLVVFVLFFNILAFAQNKGIKVDLQIGEEDLFIEFIDKKTYTFYSPFGGHLWGNYPYILEKGVLTLKNNGTKIFDIERLNNLIFPKGNSSTFVYDENYKDFYCTGVYKNEEVILRDFKNQTPVGSECFLNGIKVVKYDKSKSNIIAKENLKIRKAPNLSAETGKFNYSTYFCPAPSYVSRHPLGNSFTPYSDYIVQDNGYLPLLLAGLVVSYDAVTVQKDTIDDITAPWYRIAMYDRSDEGTDEYFWVFGGYIKEVTDPDNPEYVKILVQNAVGKGVLKKE